MKRLLLPVLVVVAILTLATASAQPFDFNTKTTDFFRLGLVSLKRQS